MNSKKLIFISYAKEDWHIANKLYSDLLNEGFSPWLDTKDLLPGQNWKTEIEEKISHAAFFIALLSKHSISKRGYVQKELKSALNILDQISHTDIFLLPVRLEPCEPVHPRLRDLHWIDLFSSYQDALYKIAKALRHQIDKQRSVAQSETNRIKEQELPSILKGRFRISKKKVFHISREEYEEYGRICFDYLLTPAIPRLEVDEICLALVPTVTPFLLPISKILAEMFGFSLEEISLGPPKHSWIHNDRQDSCSAIRYDAYFKEPKMIMIDESASGWHFDIEDSGFTFQAWHKNRDELSEEQRYRFIEFGTRIMKYVDEIVQLIWAEGSPRSRAAKPYIKKHGDWGGDALFIRTYPR